MRQVPTAVQLFGPTPWVTDPVPGANTGAGFFPYNNHYFATVATAQKLCSIIEQGAGLEPGSCKVIEVQDISNMQNQLNEMIQLPSVPGAAESPRNAGLMAEFFDDFPYEVNLNQAFTAELGIPFTYTPAPAVIAPKPTPILQLMVGKVGEIKQQPDGTYWKRVATSQG